MSTPTCRSIWTRVRLGLCRLYSSAISCATILCVRPRLARVTAFQRRASTKVWSSSFHAGLFDMIPTFPWALPDHSLGPFTVFHGALDLLRFALTAGHSRTHVADHGDP